MHICIVQRFDLHCRSMRYVKIDVIIIYSGPNLPVTRNTRKSSPTFLSYSSRRFAISSAWSFVVRAMEACTSLSSFSASMWLSLALSSSLVFQLNSTLASTAWKRWKIYIIMEKPQTFNAVDPILPPSDRRAAWWICSDGPKEQQRVVKQCFFNRCALGRVFLNCWYS